MQPDAILFEVFDDVIRHLGVYRDGIGTGDKSSNSLPLCDPGSSGIHDDICSDKLRGCTGGDALPIVDIAHEWAVVAAVLDKLLDGLDERTGHTCLELALCNLGGDDMVADVLLRHGCAGGVARGRIW